MKTKVIAFLPAIILLAFYATGYVIGQSNPLPSVQAQSFDHSQCQYPDRTSNPVDGCDNTDPCDPANVKGGDGSCSDALPAQPVIEPVAPVTQAPEPAVSCGK
jgi:hypothetical protein